MPRTTMIATEIKYGGYVYHLNRPYRLSPMMDNKEIAGKLVYVKELMSQQGCDWLKVRLLNDTEYLVKPFFVIPA